MLQFNPFFRPSIEECLESSYFDNVRMFSVAEKANKTVNLAFEYEDYLSLIEIRKLMVEEI